MLRFVAAGPKMCKNTDHQITKSSNLDTNMIFRTFLNGRLWKFGAQNRSRQDHHYAVRPGRNTADAALPLQFGNTDGHQLSVRLRQTLLLLPPVCFAWQKTACGRYQQKGDGTCCGFRRSAFSPVSLTHILSIRIISVSGIFIIHVHVWLFKNI